MKVRLTRKHADRVDGIDLRGHNVGDILELPTREAELILAEEWAIPERRLASTPSDERRRAEDR